MYRLNVGACHRPAFGLHRWPTLRSRDEYIYKAALTHRILMGTHSLRTACMLNEFRTGKSKADVAILNGTTTVYEIKSERDSLTRLEQQLDNYRKVFASVYVIAGESHVNAVLEATPSDVGVVSLSRRFQITTRRNAENLPQRICPLTVFEALRTAEAADVVLNAGLSVPDVPNTRMRSELRDQFVRLAPKVVHAGMLRTLKRTRNLLPLERLVDRLPLSLHAAALSVCHAQSRNEPKRHIRTDAPCWFKAPNTGRLSGRMTYKTDQVGAVTNTSKSFLQKSGAL